MQQIMIERFAVAVDPYLLAIAASTPLLSTTIFWLLAGSIMCLMEFFFPTAFVAFMMGIAALLVALVSLLLPQISLQVALWLIFSTLLIFLSRRFFAPKRPATTLEAAREGETLSEIPPGQAGRVLYEGNSWRAKCEDEETAIAANQRVYVLRREGNTLIVMPHNILHY
ncbi:MAG: NfeD family protein [Oscillatoria sp. PMC 1051.18]|nr:NfeD family protein [Oscillatoria sp. PMC 1051.18]